MIRSGLEAALATGALILFGACIIMPFGAIMLFWEGDPPVPVATLGLIVNTLWGGFVIGAVGHLLLGQGKKRSGK